MGNIYFNHYLFRGVILYPIKMSNTTFLSIIVPLIICCGIVYVISCREKSKGEVIIVITLVTITIISMYMWNENQNIEWDKKNK